MTYHHDTYQSINPYEWEEKNIPPFEELIVSWNGYRPQKGYFLISVSLLKEEWTPYVDYAMWSGETQNSFHATNPWIESFQDIITVKEGQAKGFRIRIEAKEEANINALFALHACTSQKKLGSFPIHLLASVLPIGLPGLSQLALEHPRSRSFCSPTSTTAVLRFLLSNQQDPISFADRVYDHAFDIYGNWVFNMAQASLHLGPDWRCWVARLHGIPELMHQLQQGYPVVVSVKGAIPGTLIPYETGHLIAIRGYDARKNQILCMDPAYPTNQETLVGYDLEAFRIAWERRKCLAYVFKKGKTQK